MGRLEIASHSTCVLFIASISVFVIVKSNELTDRKRIDPVWSEQIELLQYDYEENGTAPNEINPITSFFGWENSGNPSKPERQKGWDLVGQNQVPYYAVIYMPYFGYNEKEPNPKNRKYWYISIEPGKACGAILLSNNKILTTCGCVYYWYMKARFEFTGQADANHREFEKDPQGGFNFTIFQDDKKYKFYDSHEIFDQNGVPKLYVHFEELYFVHDKSNTHFVDSDLKHYNGYDQLSCRGAQELFKPNGLKFGLTVLHIKPFVQNWDVSHFVPWPPEPLLNLTVKAENFPPGIKCRLITMGAMPIPPERNFLDDFGKPLILANALVDIEMKTVPFDNCSDSFPELFTSGLDPEMLRVLTCVEFIGWDWEDPGDKWSKPQLSGGLPGSPILSANGFVAGFLIDAPLLKDDLSGATKDFHHYHLMGNFALDYYQALDDEVGHLIKYSGIRQPLAREDPDFFLSDTLEYSAGNPQEMVPLPPAPDHKPLNTRDISQRSGGNTAMHKSFPVVYPGFLIIFLTYTTIN